MVKHDWHDALRKSGRNPSDMNLQDLMGYFEQIELLKGVKQKSKTIIVDDDSDKQQNLVVSAPRVQKQKQMQKATCL
eukprot:9944432-Ditylum_brightwellii.AAC.1